MIKPAYLHAEELKKEFVKTWTDPKYKYYFVAGYRCIPTNINHKPIDDMWHRSFVSVCGENDEIIGCIQYDLDRSGEIVDNLSVISFNEGGLQTAIFAADFRQVLKDIFEKYNCRTILFKAVEGNPAAERYISIVERIGGIIGWENYRLCEAGGW